MARINLTLVLPGLAPILEQKINTGIIPFYLAKVLSKATFQQYQAGLSRLLFNHFSDTELTGTDLPMRSLELGQTHSLRADPCYVHADRDRLLLFTEDLALTVDESAEFIKEIQPLFDEFNGKLSQLKTDNWLLELDVMPDLQFTALAEVSRKGIDKSLPTGELKRDWIRLWNEVQMTLYQSDLNERRVEANKLPINSVWFWGAGKFVANMNGWVQVQGQSRLLEQLAKRSKCTLNTSSEYSVSGLSPGRSLWLMDELELEEDWLSQLNNIDEMIVKPLWMQCRKFGVDTVTLDIPDHGRYTLTSLDCWKIWKR